MRLNSGVFFDVWFANNTSGIEPGRFSFLAAQLRCAIPCAAAGNMLHRRLWGRI